MTAPSSNPYFFVCKEWLLKYIHAFPKISTVPRANQRPREPSYFDTPGQETEWEPFYKGFLKLLQNPSIRYIISITYPNVNPRQVEQSMHMTGELANQVVGKLKELFMQNEQKRYDK